jgi:hypothetical protein
MTNEDRSLLHAWFESHVNRFLDANGILPTASHYCVKSVSWRFLLPVAYRSGDSVDYDRRTWLFALP